MSTSTKSKTTIEDENAKDCGSGSVLTYSVSFCGLAMMVLFVTSLGVLASGVMMAARAWNDLANGNTFVLLNIDDALKSAAIAS